MRPNGHVAGAAQLRYFELARARSYRNQCDSGVECVACIGGDVHVRVVGQQFVVGDGA